MHTNRYIKSRTIQNMVLYGFFKFAYCSQEASTLMHNHSCRKSWDGDIPSDRQGSCTASPGLCRSPQAQQRSTAEPRPSGCIISLALSLKDHYKALLPS